MLTDTPKLLQEEAEEAVRFRRHHTDISQDMIRDYAGKYFRSDWTPSGDHHENHAAELVTNLLPMLVFNNPRVHVETSLPGMDDDRVEAISHGLNWWAGAVKFAQILEDVELDAFFDFGVMHIGLDAAPGYEHEDPPIPLLPRPTRISPRRFFIDPYATSFDSARFMGHIWIQDLEDLQAAVDAEGKPVYDEKALAALSPEAGVNEMRQELMQGRVHHPRRRNEVVGYELWVREHGKVYTLATERSGSAEHFLSVRDYFGPPRGNYHLFGAMKVPDQLLPLPWLAVTRALENEINTHAGQAADDADGAKRVIVVDSNNKELADAIESGKHNSVLRVPGFTQSAAQDYHFGGPMAETLNYLAVLRERLDRQSGLTDIMRGNLTGVTATEVQLANRSADVRVRKARKDFQQQVVGALESTGWYMHESDQVQFFFPHEDPQTNEQVAMVFVGGPSADTPAFIRYEHLQLSIEPYSMEMVDENVLQRRMLQVTDLLTRLAPEMVRSPWIQWDRTLDDVFQALNIPDGGRRYVHWDILHALTGMMAEPGMAGPEGGAGGAGSAGGQVAPEGPEPSGGGPMRTDRFGDSVNEEGALLAEAAAA